MEWIVKIEKNNNKRIVVRVDPKNDAILFIGQIKPKNAEWVDFVEESVSIYINLETIQKVLEKIYLKLSERYDAYKNIAEGFEIIKIIGITDDDKPDDELPE